MLIIDCHCHAGEGDGFTGPWDTRAPLKKFMQWSQEAGIRKTVIFPAFHTDYARANALVAGITHRYPDRFFGFAFLHAERDKGKIGAMVKTAVEQYGFKGLKVHRHDARISREICEAARQYRIPILYDPTGEVSTVELIAGEYPDVNFIIPHLSSFADDWRAQIAFVDVLARHSNVYTDTSGVRRFDVLETAYKRAGAAKILFGTDGPWLHPAVELAKIDALNLPLRERAMVLGGNILKLLRLEHVRK
ncbi:amidohydrolase family protein [Dyadobacter sp. OTU695]|uniref:amidohydrolase family protein n=1 Tax=Dyadobacter sp. OTU695 TaxID=3043860 RepID=UPI00313C3DEB